MNICFDRTQKRLEERIAENEKFYGLNVNRRDRKREGSGESQDAQDLDDAEDLDIASGHKDICVLEVSQHWTHVS